MRKNKFKSVLSKYIKPKFFGACFLLCMSALSEEAKIHAGILYGDHVFTPCYGIASKLVGSPSDMSKLDKLMRINGKRPLFIQFTGYERKYPETVAYRHIYQIETLLFYDKLRSNLKKCPELLNKHIR